mmetsp:Transcript_24549/g.61131  ORF Transcript_24549/g.61131 Transcript_24549/m.61131 type:complete len:281 (-) Transcript_24549:251-1093(-)
MPVAPRGEGESHGEEEKQPPRRLPGALGGGPRQSLCPSVLAPSHSGGVRGRQERGWRGRRERRGVAPLLGPVLVVVPVPVPVSVVVSVVVVITCGWGGGGAGGAGEEAAGREAAGAGARAAQDAPTDPRVPQTPRPHFRHRRHHRVSGARQPCEARRWSSRPHPCPCAHGCPRRPHLCSRPCRCRGPCRSSSDPPRQPQASNSHQAHRTRWRHSAHARTRPVRSPTPPALAASPLSPLHERAGARKFALSSLFTSTAYLPHYYPAAPRDATRDLVLPPPR